MQYYEVIIDVMPSGSTSPEGGTEFDMSRACPACGTGARMVGPLIVKSGVVPGKGVITNTFEHEVLIAGTVRDELLRIGVGEEEFAPIRLRSGKPKDWWHVRPTRTLPRMLPTTRGVIRGELGVMDSRPCRVCDRDGHYHTTKEDSEFHYSREALEQFPAPLIASTWECFGPSERKGDTRRSSRPALETHIARPWRVVSEDVLEALKRVCGNRVEGNPIVLE